MTSFRTLLLLVPFAVACGGQIDTGSDGGKDGSPPPPPSDAQPPPPPSDAMPPPPVLDGGECNNLAFMGPTVTFNQIPTNAPSFPSGGSPIFQGVYVLTSFTAYTGPGGGSTPLGQGQVTLQISGSFDIQAAALLDNQAPTHTGSTGIVTGPNQIMLTGYCPQASSSNPASYYFDGSTLWLRANGGGNYVVDEQYSLITN